MIIAAAVSSVATQITCPVNNPYAIGGGVKVSSGSQIANGSYPTGGTPSVPASGWQVTFNSISGLTAVAYAVCSK